ncbi:uncharacterized, partial [Tachysurus ichikawai]
MERRLKMDGKRRSTLDALKG